MAIIARRNAKEGASQSLHGPKSAIPGDLSRLVSRFLKSTPSGLDDRKVLPEIVDGPARNLREFLSVGRLQRERGTEFEIG
jgi:hypothetical protein